MDAVRPAVPMAPAPVRRGGLRLRQGQQEQGDDVASLSPHYSGVRNYALDRIPPNAVLRHVGLRLRQGQQEQEEASRRESLE